ncbi:hypothetical protein ACLX1H_007661 [Fusarium chlamydosporum]
MPVLRSIADSSAFAQTTEYIQRRGLSGDNGWVHLGLSVAGVLFVGGFALTAAWWQGNKAKKRMIPHSAGDGDDLYSQ